MTISFSIQTDNLKMFKEVVDSHCDRVRFGSEFCELKIPSISVLKKAYALAEDKDKGFIYVTPRLSNNGLRKIREQLDFLNMKGEIDIVVNDLGLLNILEHYHNLRPHLGRQLAYIPSRCPWIEHRSSNPGSRRTQQAYSYTSLNYKPTIRFFKSKGIQGVDVDWIPRCFPHLDLLVTQGLNPSVYLHLVLVAITRKCHIARFVGEKDFENCHYPCVTNAFRLKQGTLDVELFLLDNAVFRIIKPSQDDIKKLLRIKVAEFVIAVNPITKVENRHKIDELIAGFRVEN